MNVIRETVDHPGASLRVLRLRLDRFDGAHHRHPQLELTWIERGSGLRLVGDSAEAFDDGDLVLLGSQLPHHWVSTPRAGEGLLACTVLQFAPAMLSAGAIPELATAQSLALQAHRGLHIVGGTAEAVCAELRQLPDDSLSRVGTLLRILGRLGSAPADLRPLSRASASAGSETPGGGSRRVDRVVDWIHRHYTRALGVDDAAQLAHVSPAAFSRWFRREMGKPFTEYLNDLRVGAASIKLRQSRLPIAHVAQACGFSTLSHFNTQFRRRHGVSPREFRVASAPVLR